MLLGKMIWGREADDPFFQSLLCSNPDMPGRMLEYSNSEDMDENTFPGSQSESDRGD